MRVLKRLWLACAFGGLLAAGNAQAAQEYVFAAPPRGPIAAESKVYQPIVDYLSKVLNAKIVFEYTDNWLSYENNVLHNRYDIVFDGPQFIGWRMAKYGFTPLVKLDGALAFVVITRADNTSIKKLDDLAGHTVCGFAPPNLAVLTLYNQFNNPMRQPLVLEIKNFKQAYTGVMEKRCDGGVIQALLYKKFSAAHPDATRVLFKSKPFPNQGISVSKRIPVEWQEKIRQALLSPDGMKATENLRKSWGKDFVPATSQEYEGLGVLLKDTWGFSLN